MDDVRFKLNGLDEMRAELKSLPPKLRKRALMNALKSAGRVFRDEARRLTPVLSVPVMRKGAIVRVPGTVKRAISVRVSKKARRKGDLGVFVNVRPVKGAAKGANSPKDPFYWRWLEFGARGKQGAAFLQRSVSKATEAIRQFGAVLGPAISKLNKKGAQP